MTESSKEPKMIQLPVDEKQAIRGFEVLFRTYFGPLCRMAYKMVKDKTACEDLVQDVFIKIWKNRDNLDLTQPLKSYLYKATVNTALNYLESQKKNFSIDDLFVEVGKLGAATVDQQIQFQEVQKLIDESISLLPARCKAVFILVKHENMSYAEAAEALDISVKTVENQMGKALKHMREHLQDYLGYMLMLLMGFGE